MELDESLAGTEAQTRADEFPRQRSLDLLKWLEELLLILPRSLSAARLTALAIYGNPGACCQRESRSTCASC